MSTPVPLTVRVSTPKDSRLITDEINDLTFRWIDPGGFSTCTVSLSRPLAGQPEYIDYYSTLTVTDARNGYVVWEGRLEDPARKADGSRGQVWELSAVGASAFLRDVVRPRIYVDSTFSGFQRVDNLAPAGQDSLSDDPGGSGKDAMVLQFPQSMAVTTGTNMVMRNEQNRDAGAGGVALVRYSWDAGVTDSNYQLQAVMATSSTGNLAASHPLSTAGSPSPVQVWQTTHYPTGRYRLEFKLARAAGGAATVPNDNYWVSVFDLIFVGSRSTRDGTPITAGSSYNPWVLAHEVIEDLLGGYGDYVFDKSRANVAATATTQITQLAYVDGADAEAVLTDLMAIEGGYTWRVWDRDTSSGGYVFEWVPIPTSVRYEADVIDGYDSNASGDGVYNGVTVRWRDAKGKSRSTSVSNFNEQLLTNMGIERTAQIELGDEIGGSQTAAQRAGEQWLADRATPANAGRLRIARPIYDFDVSRMVQPWEIRPGLIRVRGVLPRPDALNATSRDGITIFRIVGCEYSAADGAATLELDSYPPSMAQLVGQLRELARPGGKRRDWLNRPIRRRPS